VAAYVVESTNLLVLAANNNNREFTHLPVTRISRDMVIMGRGGKGGRKERRGGGRGGTARERRKKDQGTYKGVTRGFTRGTQGTGLRKDLKCEPITSVGNLTIMPCKRKAGVSRGFWRTYAHPYKASRVRIENLKGKLSEERSRGEEMYPQKATLCNEYSPTRSCIYIGETMWYCPNAV
jgi:hypothetical protein